MVQILSSLFEQRRWSRHFVSNELVEDRDDDEVEVRSYFQFVLGKEEGRVIGVGDYRAVMRPVDGSLRICEFSASIVDEVEVPSTMLDRVSVSVDREVDLYSVETFAEGRPVELYAWLLANDPVHWHPEPDGPGFWVISRWADIRFVNSHDDLFSHWPVSMIEDYMETEHKSMVNLDPPLHTQIRKAVIPGSCRVR